MAGQYYPGQEDQNLLSPSAALIFGHSMFFTAGGLTSGISGKNPFRTESGSRLRAIGSAGGYLTGKHTNVMLARKLTGQTLPSRLYSRMAYSGGAPNALGRLAPSLGHMLPSRYLTLWSGLAGERGALQGLGMMAGVEDLRSWASAQDLGDIFDSKNAKAREFFKGRSGVDFRQTAKSGIPFRDSIFGNVPGWEGKWGDYIDPSNLKSNLKWSGGTAGTWADMQWLSGTDKEFREAMAKSMAQRAGFIGENAGRVSNKVSGYLIRKIAVEQSKTFISLGKLIKPAMRLGGVAMVGFDIYTAANMLGKGMGKLALHSMKAPVNTYNMLTSDIHRGTFMSSSPLSPFVGATGRQRAMANIFDRQLNLRQVLGNEAGYLANLGY